MSDERLRKLENNYSKMEEKIDNLCDKLDDVPTKKEMELANEKLIQKTLKQADGRYASKVVELIVFGGAGIALTYLINEVLSII